jgi:signal peptidase II
MPLPTRRRQARRRGRWHAPLATAFLEVRAIATAAIDRYRHLAPLLRVAVLVAVGDFLTKEAAARWLVREPIAPAEWLHFAVVHNPGAAFGISLGEYTRQLNLALTLAAIAFVVAVARDLSRVDRSAPRVLGLIMGGAVGNLISLVLSPRGVVDFIAVGVGDSSRLVLNVADVAAYVGLAMLVRTGFIIVGAMRRQVQTPAYARAETPVPLVAVRHVEIEVARPVHHEPSMHDPARVPLDAFDPLVMPPRPALAPPVPFVERRKNRSAEAPDQRPDLSAESR